MFGGKFCIGELMWREVVRLQIYWSVSLKYEVYLLKSVDLIQYSISWIDISNRAPMYLIPQEDKNFIDDCFKCVY